MSTPNGNGTVDLTDALVHCTCGQLLAEQWEHGAYNVVGTTRFQVERDRRIVLYCPACGKKTRLHVANAA